jgi:hypothetical protein
MFGSIGDAAQQYLSGGGMLGYLTNLFAPQQPTVTYGGDTTMTVTETGPTAPVSPIVQEILADAQKPSGEPKAVLPPSLMREVGADTTGKDYRRAFAEQELRKNIQRFGKTGGFDPKIGFTRGR